MGTPDHGGSTQKHTTDQIPRWPPTLALVACSSDQSDSTSKPTSDVVEDFRAAVRNLEDIFVRVTVEHHVSRPQIGRLTELTQ